MLYFRTAALFVFFGLTKASTLDPCFVKNEDDIFSPWSDNFRMVYCNRHSEECCDNGCCPRKTSPTEDNGDAASPLARYFWFILFGAILGIICLLAGGKILCENGCPGGKKTDSEPPEATQNQTLLSNRQENDVPKIGKNSVRAPPSYDVAIFEPPLENWKKGEPPTAPTQV